MVFQYSQIYTPPNINILGTTTQYLLKPISQIYWNLPSVKNQNIPLHCLTKLTPQKLNIIIPVFQDTHKEPHPIFRVGLMRTKMLKPDCLAIKGPIADTRVNVTFQEREGNNMKWKCIRYAINPRGHHLYSGLGYWVGRE